MHTLHRFVFASDAFVVCCTDEQCAGDVTMSGKELGVVEGHISADNPWARAIFTSPSIHYAAHPLYAQLIDCKVPGLSGQLQVVLQIRQKPGLLHLWQS
jgi:hypothetical protein